MTPLSSFVLKGFILGYLALLINAELKDEYNHAAYLDADENYQLFWSVKDADKSSKGGSASPSICCPSICCFAPVYVAVNWIRLSPWK